VLCLTGCGCSAVGLCADVLVVDVLLADCCCPAVLMLYAAVLLRCNFAAFIAGSC
jgi:hypothetical protein